MEADPGAPGEKSISIYSAATLLYCVASLVASEAIDLHVYYTGSLFDVPLVGGMAWFVRIAFLASEAQSENAVEEFRSRGLWNLESTTGDGWRFLSRLS